jgi:hypothetical protein
VDHRVGGRPRHDGYLLSRPGQYLRTSERGGREKVINGSRPCHANVPSLPAAEKGVTAMRHFPVSPAAAERTKVEGGRRCFIASDDLLDAQGQRTI